MRWRAIRAWVLALLVLPAAGAAGFVVVLETAGGDLGRWSPAAAVALVVVAFVGPAALSGAYVINDPFWWSADDKFFGYSLAKKIAVAFPRTVMLPQKD